MTSNPPMYSDWKQCPYCLTTQAPEYAHNLDFDCIDRKRCALQLIQLVEDRIRANTFGTHYLYAIAEVRKAVRNG